MDDNVAKLNIEHLGKKLAHESRVERREVLRRRLKEEEDKLGEITSRRKRKNG